jgi:hypothetical protein
MFVAVELALLLMVIALSSKAPHAAPAVVRAEPERNPDAQPRS